jgi:hypothetical protein
VETQCFGPRLEIEFWWRPTGYNYPDPISKDLKTKHNHPAVYRWAIYPPTSTDPGAQYIGETANLVKRAQQYLKPGRTQKTNQRLKEILDGQLIQGTRIQLETFELKQFEILAGEDSILVSTFELHDQFKRKMMENFAVLVKPEYCKLLNLVIDTISKRIRRAEETKKLLGSPEGRGQLYEDRDIKTILEILKRREQTEPHAQTH